MIQRQTAESPTYLLPPAAYTSSEWFDREQRSLFGPRWALVASIDDLQSPGDYATARIGTAPVVVIRGDGGELRAFQNLCRHRGMVLLQGTGNVSGAISCFYHQWRYALDGELRIVPQRKEQFPDLDVAAWGLLPASVDVWEGLVFAHPDPAAAPLAASIAGVTEHLGSHRPGLLRQVATTQLEARCNWKLFVENHVDVYHLWYLHGESLGDFDHTRFEYHQIGRNWASYEPLKHDELDRAALTSGTTPITHLADRDRYGLGAHLVFPNLMMATAAEFFATYVATPVAPDRTVIEFRVRAEENADPLAVQQAVESFIKEDIDACEAVQAAVASPAFAVGPLARDHERPIAVFHANILEAIG